MNGEIKKRGERIAKLEEKVQELIRDIEEKDQQVSLS